MGGYMSALIASVSDQPLTAVPCVTPHYAAPVFCEGKAFFGGH